MIFVVGSVTLVILSNYFNRTRGVVTTKGLSVSFSGTWHAILRGAAIHAPVLALIVLNVVPPHTAAYSAALLPFGFFVWYMKKGRSPYQFYKVAVFYAGLLTTALGWILYLNSENGVV